MKGLFLRDNMEYYSWNVGKKEYYDDVSEMRVFGPLMKMMCYKNVKKNYSDWWGKLKMI